MNKDRLTMDVGAEARELGARGILNDPRDSAIVLAVEEIVGWRLKPHEVEIALREYARGEQEEDQDARR